VTEKNIVTVFQQRIVELGDRPAYRVKQSGKWVARSWREYGERVKAFGMGLMALGMQAGAPLAVLATTREEWDIADRAALAVGGIGVGVYHSNTPDQVCHVIGHSEARVVVVENLEQWKKLSAVRKDLPRVRNVITMDPLEDVSDPTLMHFEEVIRLGRDNEKELEARFWLQGRKIRNTDPAIYVYTSGTTGPPKGAVLSHGNLLAMVDGFAEIGIYRHGRDSVLVWLPLPHILGRFIISSCIYTGNRWDFAESIEKVMDNLREVRPTVFFSVPRLYEKIHTTMLTGLADASPVKKRVFDFCMDAGNRFSECKKKKEKPSPGTRVRYALAERLLFRRIHALFGGRLRYAISGGAPISKEILEFFYRAGISILEGYGLTEVGMCSLNRPSAFRFGTVGPPTPGVDVRVEKDGEVLIRSPMVFQGYLKDPEQTSSAFSADGWFRSGDIGVIHENGFLSITDRKKDLIVTSGGKNVAPQNIENLLKTSFYISQAMVYGDRRNYLVALIVPDREGVERWAGTRGIRAASFEDLCKQESILGLMEAEIRGKNRELAKFETIKRFRLLAREFTQEDGELTPTMKIKRRVVSEKYRGLLEEMYHGGSRVTGS